MATTTISMDEAIALAQQQMDAGSGGLQGIANVGNLGNQAIQPIDVTTPPPPPPSAPAVRNDGNWQRAFQAELKACENLGFFSRPSCAWAARNKNGAPQAAWGTVAARPATKSPSVRRGPCSHRHLAGTVPQPRQIATPDSVCRSGRSSAPSAMAV
jgi:hypothetical protein